MADIHSRSTVSDTFDLIIFDFFTIFCTERKCDDVELYLSDIFVLFDDYAKLPGCYLVTLNIRCKYPWSEI